MIDPYSQIARASTREVCTKDRPCPPTPQNGRWSHPDAVYVRDEGTHDVYECPYCGLRFRVELPE